MVLKQRLLRALAKVLEFPKQPRILEKENEEFQFKVGEDLLNSGHVLTKEELGLMNSEIDRYSEVIDLLDEKYDKDYEEISDLWTNYVEAIEERINRSLKKIQRKRLHPVGSLSAVRTILDKLAEEVDKKSFAKG